LFGASAILLAGRAADAIKIRREDMERIEAEAGRKANALAPEELEAVMSKLGVEKIPLTDEDIYLIDLTNNRKNLPANCSGCGSPAQPENVCWHNNEQAECLYCGSGLVAK
jgi:hypothetical protein